jgi:CheY-like chemotaxis protein
MPFIVISRSIEMGVRGINPLRAILVSTEAREVMALQPEESNEPLPAKQRTRAATILIVEDDEDLREVIRLLMLTIPAYHYYLVPDASQAIQFTKGVKPDLFIVDYRLPAGMNGLELYDQLHATPGLEVIPAILMTATRLEALRPEIEQRQITVLEKPFDLDTFFLMVQRMLGTPSSETRADEGRT